MVCVPRPRFSFPPYSDFWLFSILTNVYIQIARHPCTKMSQVAVFGKTGHGKTGHGKTGHGQASTMQSIQLAGDLESRKIERAKHPGAECPEPSFNSVAISSETTAEVNACKPCSETFNRKRTPLVPENSFAELATYIYAAGTSAVFAMWFNQAFLQDASQPSQICQILLVIQRILQIRTEVCSSSYCYPM